jgi:hypothetical protein
LLSKTSPSPLSNWLPKSNTGLDLCFCVIFGDRAFPVLLLKSVTLTFERLVAKIQYEVVPSLLWGFRRSGILCIAVKKYHPRLRVSGRRNLVRDWTFAFVGCMGLSVIGHSLYCCQKASPSPLSIWSSKSSAAFGMLLRRSRCRATWAIVTHSFKAKTRCSSYVCLGSSCHTYGQNISTENQCLYYIVSYYKNLLQVQKGLNSGTDTILPQADDRRFRTLRRSLYQCTPHLLSSRA